MGWIITRDLISDKGEKVTGLMGPRNITDATQARLNDGEGEKFRMLDDDSIPYYHGRYLEDDSEQEDGIFAPGTDEFQPLDNYGAPNAGCTMVEYKDEAGEWQTL